MNKLLILFIFVPCLAFILLILNLLLAPHNPDEEKISSYECGFLAIEGQTRSQFHIHFYLVTMLFLIFDLEILLLFPISVTLYQVSTFGFSVALVFFIILTIGFIVEIGSGVIGVDSAFHVYDRIKDGSNKPHSSNQSSGFNQPFGTNQSSNTPQNNPSSSNSK